MKSWHLAACCLITFAEGAVLTANPNDNTPAQAYDGTAAVASMAGMYVTTGHLFLAQREQILTAMTFAHRRLGAA